MDRATRREDRTTLAGSLKLRSGKPNASGWVLTVSGSEHIDHTDTLTGRVDKPAPMPYGCRQAMKSELSSGVAEPRCEQCALQPSGGGAAGVIKLSGFTLIELLVVIAIIAILAAMLFPALAPG